MQNGENDKKKKSNKNRGKKSELTRVNATNLPHTTWYQDKKNRTPKEGPNKKRPGLNKKTLWIKMQVDSS